MHEYRQALVRMRLGDSDRDISRSRLMGRRKAAELRQLAERCGWLSIASPLPEDAAIAAALPQAKPARSSVSTLEVHREQVAQWVGAGVQMTTIHAALRRERGWQGSYSAVRSMAQAMRAALRVPATMVLAFNPAEAAQVDFGAGPVITDAISGEVARTWVFVMTLCWSRHQYADRARPDRKHVAWLPSAGLRVVQRRAGPHDRGQRQVRHREGLYA